MKRLLALSLAATLALTSSVLVFADEVAPVVPVAEEAAPAVEAVAEVEAVVEEVVEEVVVEVVNVPYTGKETRYTNEGGLIIGTYPIFSNNEALSKKMFNTVNDAYFNMYHIQENEFLNYVVEQGLGHAFRYSVEESLTAAKIDIYSVELNLVTAKYDEVVIATYYVEKESNKEITAAAYAEILAAETEAPEVAPVDEPVEEPVVDGTEGEGVVAPVAPVVEFEKVPVRAQAEALGCTVEWDNGTVTVTLGDKVATLVVGVNSYVSFTGEVVELEDAPENIDGTVYVPTSFFTLVVFAE